MTTVRWSLLVGLASGCSSWPRFANPPEGLDDIEPAELAGPPWFDHVAEEGPTPADDWPNDPSVAAGSATLPLGLEGLGDGVALRGALGADGSSVQGWGVLAEGQAPFTCLDADLLPGTYTGDVDFALLDHAGGPICVLLDAAPGVDGSALWDVQLYAWNGTCLTGGFLGPGSVDDPSLAAAVAPGERLFVPEAFPGLHAVYVAGASGTYDDRAVVPYLVLLVPVATVDACAALDLDALVESVP